MSVTPNKYFALRINTEFAKNQVAKWIVTSRIIAPRQKSPAERVPDASPRKHTESIPLQSMSRYRAGASSETRWPAVGWRCAYSDLRLNAWIDVTQVETPVPEYEHQIDTLEEQIPLGRNKIGVLAGKSLDAGDSITLPTLAQDASACL
ncbi:hypothetical protein SAMN05414139_03939 [Burkholderia sp. D7]|nr:hypothetical protein SAMN05414139_03939 [Burkholderia sp. D7]